MVAATCVFEGSAHEVEEHERRLNDVAEQFKGVVGGEENGIYGYRLTFAIAYLRVSRPPNYKTVVVGPGDGVRCVGRVLRDVGPLGQGHKSMSECQGADEEGVQAARSTVPRPLHLPVSCPLLLLLIPFISRVTQAYDAGACVYFYFGFNARGLENGLEVYDKIEVAGRMGHLKK